MSSEISFGALWLSDFLGLGVIFVFSDQSFVFIGDFLFHFLLFCVAPVICWDKVYF